MLERYREGAREVEEALAGITKEELDAHPLAGVWSVRDIVHHLADSEMIGALRLRRLLVEEHPTLDC